jgi:peptidoglycan L-alanyl-D-glutamate endopeptidase CwlK
MSITLGERSLSRLQGVHPDLVRVVKRAAAMSDLDFTVLEGLRTLERQKQLVKAGASKTMNSRHLTGHAVDIAPMLAGAVSWDWPLYRRLAPIVKAAAVAENVPIEWGGDWRTFKDGPHWQLPFKGYPK